MSEKILRIYLAGPDVFEPNAVEIGEAKKALCQKYGFEGCFPLDNVIEDFAHDRATGLRIGRANESLMDSCDLVIANMQPWHGPSMDVGTAYEMGYMRAQGKSIYGYSSDVRTLATRVEDASDIPLQDTEDGGKIDGAGKTVEIFEMIDNLMLINALDASGYDVFSSLEDVLKALAHSSK